jgi:Predicted metal-dependent protease of the PAD1/JAB1 superfamily
MIRLPAGIARSMRQAAERAYPEECCGLLVGQTDATGAATVGEAVAAANVARDRRYRFEVDPAVHFRLLRSLRATDMSVVGHYHSHPDHPAAPSAHDLAMVSDPTLVWLIIGVSRGQAGPIAAFRPRTDASGFTALPLRIEASSEDAIGGD